MTAALTPEQQGNLDAAASMVPGIIAGAGGPSALGLDPSQNQQRVNGLAFGGGGLPRCVEIWPRVTTSSLDPGRGGFSGAQIDANIEPGNLFAFRSLRVAVDAPPLQLNDPVSRATGLARTNVQGCLAASGELAFERWYYNSAVQVNRRVADVTDLIHADASLLGNAGLAGDSVARLFTSLRNAGIPTAGTLAGVATTDATALLRLDHGNPYRNTTQGIFLIAALGQDQGLGLSSGNTGTVTARQTRANVVLQGSARWTFRTDWMNEVRSGLSWSHRATAPDFALPSGNVVIGSSLADGTTTTSAVGFGGSPFANGLTDALTWEMVNELQRITGATGAHRLALTGMFRVDALRSASLDNGFGSFTFNSLADLAADRPASFARTLYAPEARSGQVQGALALGDQWRIARNFRVQLGARAEVNSWLVRPADNPAVTSAFGLRTTDAPNRVHVSPRLGFEWRYGGGEGYGVTFTSVARFLSGMRGAVRGGIGEFRNTMPTSLLVPMRQSTGLATGAQRVACYGNDVPARDWFTWGANPAAIPASCVSGGGLLVDAAPAVQLFAPDYQPERSWRAHLEWQTPVPGFLLTLRGTYSLNLNQPSGVDLNFRPQQQFTLPDENGRSVWVPLAGITPASGAVSPVGAREFRGCDGAGAGDPNVVEWARGTNDVRHVAQLMAGTNVGPVGFSVRAWAQSGRPFTPVVSGDITGTGRGGERAFVFSPGSALDTAGANGMQALLARAPTFAQACLRAQLGQVAVRNSCEGPWTGGLNATLSYNGSLPGLGRRAQFTLTAGNVLSGIDQLANGSANLQGWGLAIPPDPVLLTVRGFDPVARRRGLHRRPHLRRRRVRAGADASARRPADARLHGDRRAVPVAPRALPPQHLQSVRHHSRRERLVAPHQHAGGEAHRAAARLPRARGQRLARAHRRDGRAARRVRRHRHLQASGSDHRRPVGVRVAGRARVPAAGADVDPAHHAALAGGFPLSEFQVAAGDADVHVLAAARLTLG
ncbi:MAG: hypothetical protein HY275_00155 [Gemmatimonadetes bacterium]|nr:hypothetical protein [Gemmatimonadota bacterium]